MGHSLDLCLASFAVLLCVAYSLECYSCTNQDSNKEKCIKTSKQCTQYQDSCVSYIRWAIPPYWTPRGNRIHFVSKDCDTQVNCAKKQLGIAQSCVRDWYLDWACVECCTGDLCNYYVTLGSSRIHVSMWTIAIAAFVMLVNYVRVWIDDIRCTVSGPFHRRPTLTSPRGMHQNPVAPSMIKTDQRLNTGSFGFSCRA